MSQKELTDLISVLILALSGVVAVLLIVQSVCEYRRAWLEGIVLDRIKFKELCVKVIRQELHKAGFYDLRNKEDCSPECKEVIHGMRVLCIVLIASDGGFSVSAFQMRCFEGNAIFDDEIDNDEQLRARANKQN